MRINYGYPAWNTDPSKIDSGSLLMREGANGRLVQVHLVETEPNSSVFTGLYSIGFRDIEQIKVDFFVPPQDLLNTTAGMKKIAGMIAANQLRRNPFILRRTMAKSQTIEIFDTRQQAQVAMKAYRAEQQLQGLQGKKYPSDSEVATAELAANLKAKQEAAAAAAERVRMEQLEAQKLAAMLAKEAEMNAKQKEQRRRDAEKFSAEAMELYRQDKFKEAVEKFGQAIELDPENRSYYFQYGMALHRIENYNRSLVYLGLAEGPSVNPGEKNFYMGLNYFKLKEYPNALAAFDRVIASKNEDLSPSAEFYKGIVHFEEKKWVEARNAFQAVLDTSKDPKLDQSAETYLEHILRIQQFEMERSRKWQLSLTLGEQYDSNVNLISDSSLSQGSASNVDGYRTLIMGSARYRPVYTETREWAVQLDAIHMYTVNNSMEYLQSLRNSDPTVVTLTAPWTHKGMLWGKGYKLDVTPGYESITMSVEDNTQKEIIGSYYVNFTNFFVMHERLFSNFNLELRNDMNKMASVTGDSDSTATKVKLINSNMHLMSEDKTKIMTTEVSFTNNVATGKNATYNRIDAAIGWIQPFYGETTATAKLGYFALTYPLKSDNRSDNSLTLTLGGSKKLNDSLSAGLVANYNSNTSNTDSYTYKKWTLMLTLSALTAF